MAVIFHLDGTQETVDPQSPPSFTLAELQAMVGGYIEVIPVPRQGFLVLNEEGKLQGLSYNELATEHVQQYLLPGDYIVGTAVLVTSKELGD